MNACVKVIRSIAGVYGSIDLNRLKSVHIKVVLQNLLINFLHQGTTHKIYYGLTISHLKVLVCRLQNQFQFHAWKSRVFLVKLPTAHIITSIPTLTNRSRGRTWMEAQNTQKFCFT